MSDTQHQVTEDTKKAPTKRPLPVEEKENDIHQVEAIVGKRTLNGGHKQVLVKWQGYTVPTWEPIANLAHCVHHIEEYEKRNCYVTEVTAITGLNSPAIQYICRLENGNEDTFSSFWMMRHYPLLAIDFYEALLDDPFYKLYVFV